MFTVHNWSGLPFDQKTILEKEPVLDITTSTAARRLKEEFLLGPAYCSKKPAVIKRFLLYAVGCRS